MSNASDLAIEMSRATLNAAVSAGSRTALEVIDRVTRLQVDSMSRLAAENTRVMTALVGDGGFPAGGLDWPKFVGESLRSSDEMARSLWEASIRAQVEMVELGAKLVVASNARLSEQLESVGRAFESSTSAMVKSLAGAAELEAAEAPPRKKAA